MKNNISVEAPYAVFNDLLWFDDLLKIFTKLSFFINLNGLSNSELKEIFENKRILKGKWNYLKVIIDNLVVYIVLSAKEVKSRNSYLWQYISTVYNKFYFDKWLKKKIFVYLFDTSSKSKTDYHKFIYRSLLTLWISILNSNELGLSLDKFLNYYDFSNSRKLMKKKNNNSTFFEETDNNIKFYWKVFWANWKESTFLCLTISKLINKKIIFYQVIDNDQDKLSQTDIDLLESNNVIIDNEIIEEYTNSISIKWKDVKTLRDTPKFHYNLFKKYWEWKKCYLCWCDIEKIIIWSHIHRVTDIEKDSSLDDIIKWSQIVDWDNWFWLCANHDKLFEWGIIYFEKEKLIFNYNLIQKHQMEFVEEITSNYEILPEHFNKKMDNYLDKHRNRVKNI